jgi:HRI1 protein
MTEPTSTLVLSGPSGLFVDVRILLKELLAGVPSDPRTLPHVPTNPRPFQPNSDFKALEWGIAGKASYESTTTPEGDSRRRGEWTHWIDSRTVQPAMDAGDIEPRKDGSALETGTMEHPETGKMTPYSEVWVHETVENTPQEKGPQLRAKGTYAVVQCDDENRGIRGRIVWVGKYCQGVVREGENVVVERWEYDSSDHGGAGQWVRTWRSGDGPLLPCGWVVKEAEEMRKGTVLNVPVLEGKGGQWTVIETDFE